MTVPKVVLEGEDELLQKFAQMQAAAKGKAIRNAVRAGALVVENSAKEKAPWKTGNLSRSIHHQIGSDGPGRVAATVGTDVVYAARQEFGFVGADSLGRVYNQAARPYLRPALDENRAEIEKEMQETFRQLIMEAVI